MKPTNYATGRLLLICLAVFTMIGLISWDYRQSPGQFEQSINDTTPKKPVRPADGKTGDREKKIRDLDDVLNELDAADLKVDMEKVQKQIAEAMKSIDHEKIQLDIEKAMKSVDMAKIQKQVQESLAKVDYSKIQAEITQAMKNIDMEKIQKEVQESLAKVDWDNMKTEMQKMKEIDMKKLEIDMQKLKEEMKELGPKMEKEMKKAKVEIEKAKAGIKEYKKFVDGLESDGLINKKQGYSLRHKDGELYINGNKASDKTYSKYRSFLEKHKKFNIEFNDKDSVIDID
jgi:hypothetical protein